MNLLHALKLTKDPCLAFVGAGGKTTALFQLARELISNQIDRTIRTVLITTTTHFGNWQAAWADHHYCIQSYEDIKLLLKQDLPSGVVMLTGEPNIDRLAALEPTLLDKIRSISKVRHIPLLIEADGARMRPLKAPGEHEPVIPNFVNGVIVILGLSGIGKPLTHNQVYRPEQFAKLSGLKIGDVITPEAISKVTSHPEGGLKNIPAKARKICLLSQADTPELQAQADSIASQLLPSFHSVIIASLIHENVPQQAISSQINQNPPKIFAIHEQVAGIILAAGESSRFGTPKQLLLWRGKPFIRHVVLLALEAGISPVVVVVGASAKLVAEAISDLPVRIVRNWNWRKGQSSSIKAGISSLSDMSGATFFLLADQPQIPAQLIRLMVELHHKTLAPIIAPLIDGQRGNPVLFDSTTFQELTSLQGNSGGRDLFSLYPIQWVPWQDSNMLMDIDTPEEYNRFLDIYQDH